MSTAEILLTVVAIIEFILILGQRQTIGLNHKEIDDLTRTLEAYQETYDDPSAPIVHSTPTPSAATVRSTDDRQS